MLSHDLLSFAVRYDMPFSPQFYLHILLTDSQVGTTRM